MSKKSNSCIIDIIMRCYISRPRPILLLALSARKVYRNELGKFI